eukprot:gnl/TRDRNA2_/TRDRNA2_84239_c0_seq2.p1 gnl/TRDRNA2_/TRDRNA2_84239_c0~~gnl/TRDRNA2_/TRDRNA2_84239_c0_seq2.p1  ORF type:complete len:783 (+),score=166.50 gnl/TRDRNA2_/TRDRNA2_84239_c0_seq2:62-2410(+)
MDESGINLGGRQGSQAWKAEHRRRQPGGFATGAPLEGKASVNTLEAEFRRQIGLCYEHVQRDLDLLHEQVLEEVRVSVAQELGGVGAKLASVRLEAREELKKGLEGLDFEPLWTVVNGLRADIDGLGHKSAMAAEGAAREAQEDIGLEIARAVCPLRDEMAEMRAGTVGLEERITQDFLRKIGTLEERLAQADDSLKRIEHSSAPAAAERLRLAAEVEAKQKRLDAQQTSAAEIQQEAERRYEQLQALIQSTAAASEERDRKIGAAFSELESRTRTELNTALGSMEEKAGTITVALDEKLRGTVDEFAVEQQKAFEVTAGAWRKDLQTSLRDLSREVEASARSLELCQEGIRFAHSCWARQVEWSAEVNPEKIEAEGRCEMESPLFSAAGISGLQLSLRVVPRGRQQEPVMDDSRPPPKRCNCGAFLRAPPGSRVSFRFHVGGQAHSFDADFSESPEWGSQKLAVMEVGVERAVLAVRLEILDVSTPLAPELGSLPAGMDAMLRIVDPGQLVAKEAALIKSRMVRRVEWCVARVPERLAAARLAAAARVDEAWDPLVSPPFAAAGFEGLQMQLYPLGYRAQTGDEQCGFFLICPRGVYLKCRAFVGDSVRTFEHRYDAREPFGRGSFCRLGDKVGEDGCVICGVELLEIRQEQSAQVRGGPFGNVADQLKVVLNPSLGCMDGVRELREIREQGGASASLGEQQQQLQQTRGRGRQPKAADAGGRRASTPPSPMAAKASLKQRIAHTSSLPVLPPVSLQPKGESGAWPLSPVLARPPKGLPRI